MAKKSMIAREVKRRKLAEKYALKREQLINMIVDDKLDGQTRWEAMLALQKFPRDSSTSRQRNRCASTGRPRGFYRRFGLARNALREALLRGDAPGVVKASW